MLKFRVISTSSTDQAAQMKKAENDHNESDAIMRPKNSSPQTTAPHLKRRWSHESVSTKKSKPKERRSKSASDAGVKLELSVPNNLKPSENLEDTYVIQGMEEKLQHPTGDARDHIHVYESQPGGSSRKPNIASNMTMPQPFPEGINNTEFGQRDDELKPTNMTVSQKLQGQINRAFESCSEDLASCQSFKVMPVPKSTEKVHCTPESRYFSPANRRSNFITVNSSHKRKQGGNRRGERTADRFTSFSPCGSYSCPRPTRCHTVDDAHQIYRSRRSTATMPATSLCSPSGSCYCSPLSSYHGPCDDDFLFDSDSPFETRRSSFQGAKEDEFSARRSSRGEDSASLFWSPQLFCEDLRYKKRFWEEIGELQQKKIRFSLESDPRRVIERDEARRQVIEGKRWSLDSGIAPSVHSREYETMQLQSKEMEIKPVDKEQLNVQNRKELDHLDNPVRKIFSSEMFGRMIMIITMISLMLSLPSVLILPGYLLRWQGTGVIVLLVVFVFLGFPLLYMEMLNGGDKMLDPWYKMTPIDGGFNLAYLSPALIQAAQSCMIFSYSLLYLINGAKTSPTWMKCESWWGADHRCLDSENSSLIINASDPAMMACSTNTTLGDHSCSLIGEMAFSQFWSKYILQVDIHALKYVGYMGEMNFNLLYCLLVLCVGLIILLAFARTKWMLINSFLALLGLGVAIALAVINVSTLDWSHIRSRDWFSLSTVEDGRVWLEATILTLRGLSLINGSVSSFSNNLKNFNSRLSLSVLMVLIHVVFLIIIGCVVLPLLQKTDLSMAEKGEIGFLVLAAASRAATSGNHPHLYALGNYLWIVLVSCTSALSLSFSIRNSLFPQYSRWTGISIGLVLFLLALPMAYGTGPTFMMLYDQFGLVLPIIILGFFQSVITIWIRGPSKIYTLTAGGMCAECLIKGVWIILPLYMAVAGLFIGVYWRPLSGPVPLPPRAGYIGAVLTIAPLVGIMVGSIICVCYSKLSVSDEAKPRTDRNVETAAPDHFPSGKLGMSSSYRNLDILDSQL